MSIRTKLYASFATLVVLLVGIGIAVSNYIDLAKDNYALLNGKVTSATQLANAERAVWELRWGVAQAIAVPEDRSKIAGESAKWNKQVLDNLALFTGANLTSEGRTATAKMRESFEKYADARAKWFELINAGKVDEAREWRNASLTPAGAATNKAFAELLEVENKLAEQSARSIALRSDNLRYIVLAAVGFALLIGAGLLIFVPPAIHQAHAELQASEDKLRGLYELSPLGIARNDMSGRFLESNEAFLRICGYSAEEMTQLDYWKLTPKTYESEEARQLESLTSRGLYGPYEKHYIRKDGSLVPVRLNGMLLNGTHGQKYIWSIIEDITDRKRAEERLRLSEENLAITLQSIGDAVIATDTAGLVTRMNPAAEALTGWTHSSAIGQPLEPVMNFGIGQ